jgi:2-methylcitrate dehydratase PrpD
VTDAGYLSFIHDLGPGDLRSDVRQHVRACLADLVGVAAAGSRTPLAALAREHAHRHMRGVDGSARLYFDGRAVSPVGAAFANAAAIDAMDGHDGHRLTKGHAGAAVLPAATSVIDPAAHDVGDLLVALVVGYEIANRAGMRLHRTAADYHSSGSWNALGAAAVTARLLGLDADATRHALGIAEHHAPRAPMMRCIDHPTMVKDSSAQGAQAGVSAALLARDGFTGPPAELVGRPGPTDEPSEDLGHRWTLLEQYFKPYPVCRWAQPAVHAAIGLVVEHDIAPERIRAIEVSTFHEATRLATRAPATTEQAQYSLPFPVATAAVHRSLDEARIASPTVVDPHVRRLADSLRLVESPEMSAAFPARRYAEVTVMLADGGHVRSDRTEAPGDPEDALTAADLAAKLLRSAAAGLGAARAERLGALTENPDTGLGVLLDELYAPVLE